MGVGGVFGVVLKVILLGDYFGIMLLVLGVGIFMLFIVVVVLKLV